MKKYLLVLTTLNDETRANKLAQSLVIQRFAACVQIEKIKSVYLWQGKVEKSIEFRLSIKTTHKKYQKLEDFLKNEHPYEVPQIVAIPIKKGLKSYLNWLNEA